MCKYKEVLSLADDMAAGAASLAFGPQHYQQFVDSRERIKVKLEELKESSKLKD